MSRSKQSRVYGQSESMQDMAGQVLLPSQIRFTCSPSTSVRSTAVTFTAPLYDTFVQYLTRLPGYVMADNTAEQCHVLSAEGRKSIIVTIGKIPSEILCKYEGPRSPPLSARLRKRKSAPVSPVLSGDLSLPLVKHFC